MSKRKYKKGKQINSIAEFERSSCEFFIWNYATRHHTVLESLQYRTLKEIIKHGCLYEAKKIDEEEMNANIDKLR
jgi:hypothetical protein